MGRSGLLLPGRLSGQKREGKAACPCTLQGNLSELRLETKAPHGAGLLFSGEMARRWARAVLGFVPLRDLGQPFGGIGIMRPHGFFDGVRIARKKRLIHAVVPLKKFFGRVQRTPLLKHEVLGNHPAGAAGNGDKQGVAGPFEDCFMEGRSERRVILEGRTGKHALLPCDQAALPIPPTGLWADSRLH